MTSNTMSSLYIPTVKACYSVEKIVFLLWKHGLGKVVRVDFAPIIRGNDEECPNFKQAFLYVDPMSAWHPDIVKSIEDGTPYKIYPNREEAFEHLRDEKEYWIILKNKSPVPYTTTTLNVHQLANNLALLEKQIAEREAEFAERETEFAKREAEFAEREAEFAEREAEFAEREAEFAHQKARISELQAVNNRLSEFNRDTPVFNDENTEEIKAYNFVTSFDNVLRMMSASNDECDNDDRYYDDDSYEEYSRSDRFNHEEDDLDNEYEECIICHQDKPLVEFVSSCSGDNVCKDCANLRELESYES